LRVFKLKNMQQFNRIILAGVALCTSATMLASCGKDNDAPQPGGDQKIQTAKFTVTVNGINPADDFASIVFSSATVSGSSTLWKVDGQVRSNENAVSFGKNDFTTIKTHIVELTQSVPGIAVGIQCLNSQASYTISYKAEVNGKVVKDDQNITVTDANDYTHDYSY